MTSSPTSACAEQPAPLPPLRAIVLRGRKAMLPYARVLEAVAERLGQCGAMHWLDYFTGGNATRFRSPRLVLLVHAGARTAGLPDAADVIGCAVFSEYVLWGVRTGAVSTEDTSGFRTVVAPEAHRAAVARRCAEELLRQGAHVALATYAGDPAEGEGASPGKFRMAVRHRTVGTYLLLQPTMAATLAGINRTVRFRLGYFRRRLLQTTACRFVPDATRELDEQGLLELNARCLNPVPDDEALLRWRACHEPGGYVVGLRTGEGSWLGLIAGWRQCGTTVLHWQMNSAGWEKHSLSLVLRSYFFEHETALHTRRIVFYGGTPHSLRHYFVPVAVTDCVLRRRSLRATLILWCARRLVRPIAENRKPNFFVEALADDDLRWSR